MIFSRVGDLREVPKCAKCRIVHEDSTIFLTNNVEILFQHRLSCFVGLRPLVFPPFVQNCMMKRLQSFVLFSNLAKNACSSSTFKNHVSSIPNGCFFHSKSFTCKKPKIEARQSKTLKVRFFFQVLSYISSHMGGGGPHPGGGAGGPHGGGGPQGSGGQPQPGGGGPGGI